MSAAAGATRVMLVATATLWHGTARIPGALARAGCEIGLLAPPGSLAEHSRHLAQVLHLPAGATPMQWVDAFADAVARVDPRVVLPCDDTAYRLLVELVLAPPPSLRPDASRALATLVRRSLGDPAHYRTSIDKRALPVAARALGVRVPASADVASADEACAFASTHGYPVVLKRSHGFAGQGVAICADAQALRAAFAKLSEAQPGFAESREGPMLIQASVDGPSHYYAVAAWNGEVVAGFAAERLVSNPPKLGPATVTRFHRGAMLREPASRLVRGFGISGFIGTEFIVDARDGQPVLIEINRRVTPGTHRGALFGVDLAAAFRAAVEGEPYDGAREPADDDDRVMASFPQEWIRDAASPWLRRYPVDIPWDEPELFRAMLGLKNR